MSMHIEEKIEVLREYSEWEGTELGEFWHYLVESWERQMSYASKSLAEAVEAEIDFQYNQIKKYSSLETTERVVPEHKETVTELVWKNQ